MPVIPTYEAHEMLDPDRRGVPTYKESMASAQAAEQQGKAIQGLGNQLETTLDSIGQRAQQQQQQQNTFATALQNRALDQDIEGAFQNYQNNSMPVGGTGFANGFMQVAQQTAQQRFDQMPEGPAKDQAMQTWAQVTKTAWLNRAAETEFKQQGVFSGQQINVAQTNDQVAVQANPNGMGAIIDRATTQIMNSPGLTTADKLKAVQDYKRAIQYTQVATLYGGDPDGMREAFGVATPGTPGSTFSRMLRAETGGDPAAVSPKGAMGLAQLMPDTARDVALHMGGQYAGLAHMSDSELGAYFTAHPDVNVQMGRTYFGQMLQRYNGDQAAAAVAYNAGPARADAWLKRGKDDDVLPKETIAYRNKVVGAPDAYHPDHQDADTAEPIPGAGARGGSGVPAPQSGPGGGLFPFLAKGKDASSVTNLNPIFSSRIEAALAQAPPEVQQGTTLFSGFRSDEHQADLFKAAVAKYGSEEAARKWVAPPGHSNHNAGQAADLKFGSDAARQWWHDNADRFGMKFPLSNEAWHIEPKETRGGGGLPSTALATGDGMLNPKYSALTFVDIHNLLANAEAGQKQRVAFQDQQAKLDTYNTQKLVDDDTASLEATGQGVRDLDPNRVVAVLGPKGYQEWQDKAAQARDVFKGSSDLESLTNDQITERVEQLRPTQGDAGEGYGRRQAVFDTVQKKAAAVLKQRTEDPASVVERSQPVQGALTQLHANPNDTTRWQGVAAARMAQQASLGIPEGMRQPLTKVDALKIIAPVNNAPSGMDGPAMKQAIAQIEAMVGPQYAPRALQFVLEQGKVDVETSRMLSALLIKAQKGQLVTQTDLANLNNVTAGVALRNSVFMGGDAGRPGVGSDAVFAPPEVASPQATVPTQSQPPTASASPPAGAARTVPSDAAVSALIRNPSKAADFDAMFGPGSATKVLKKWHTMTGAPPNG